MRFDGRLTITDADKKPFEVSASETEVWVQKMLQNAAPKEDLLPASSPEEWGTQSKMHIEARLENVGSEYLLSGSLKGEVPSFCSRCGDVFKACRSNKFNVLICRGNASEVDPETIVLRSDELDLAEVLAEQMVIVEPIAERPPVKSDGSCEHCGENPELEEPNDAFGGLSEQPVKNSPFAVLEVLKKKM